MCVREKEVRVIDGIDDLGSIFYLPQNEGM